MSKKIRFLLLPVIFLVFTAGLLYLVTTYPPDMQLIFKQHNVPLLIIFFILVWGSVSMFFSIVVKNIRRGSFIGLFVVGILLLRLYHLTNGLYILLLLGVFIALELVFIDRKKKGVLRKLSEREK